MNRTYIANAQPGQRVRISGFLENIRNKRSMAFLVLRDITGKMQITVVKDENPEIAGKIDILTLDTVVTITGEVVTNPHVKLNGVEILPESLCIESVADALPIQDDSGIDHKMDYRWIDLRSERNQLIFKVQTCIAQSFRQTMLSENFLEIHTPKLINTASESGSDVFALDYFGGQAYLAQSPQFYKQMAMASGFERVFECGPVFRAEKSYTNRHATEFTGFDIEMSYIDSYHDVMLMQEKMMHGMLSFINKKYCVEIKRLFNVDITVPQTPFPVMKLEDVYDELNTRYGYVALDGEQSDLTTEAEQLCERLARDIFNHEFLFVTHYGAEKRAFYHMRDENGIPLGYDLIWKGVEITTGAQREHRYGQLEKQAQEKGLSADVEHYLEFFKYGCPPHGGFGMGLDRITMLALNIAIKEVMFLFRGPNRLTP
ncbi:MAG: aspartate--tRNA(Asn) ligase [Defluviitaleaceae bacterium]|nr:aspartate--tRNA(Asn) ligase [Defluviitaleaceae bacterium]